MRQVPKFTKYLIIGSGRVAKNFQHYFKLLNIPFVGYSRNNDIEFNTYHSEIDNQIRLFKSAKECSHALVLITDSAIDTFISLNQDFLKNKTLVHFSGAYKSDLAVGAHPLMTFTHQLEEDDGFYKYIPFVIEENCEFEQILPLLKNPNIKISKQLKPLYHALCVASGNFTVILWQEVIKIFEQQLGIPRHYLFPYLTKVTENLLTDSEHALTGPIQRHDYDTIQSNITALENTPLKQLYLEFLNIKHHATNQTKKEVTQ